MAAKQKRAYPPPHVSDLLNTSGLRRPIIAIDVPMAEAKGGPYLLIWALAGDTFQQIVTEQHLPADRFQAIVDNEGILVARNPKPEFVGRHVSDSFLPQATGAAGTFINTSLEGTSVFNSYNGVPSTVGSSTSRCPKTCSELRYAAHFC